MPSSWERFKVEEDEDNYIEAIYRGEERGKHIWDFNIMNEGDCIVYIVEFKTVSSDPDEAVEEMLNHQGSVKCDWTKVVWWYF